MMQMAILTILIFFLSPEIVVAKEDSVPGNYYYVIKGGVSLGNYESGVNWAIVENLKRHPENGILRSFSGASAGSINALISAVEYFKKSSEPTCFIKNAFRDSWDLGIDELLGLTESSDGDEDKINSVFSHKPLRSKAEYIESRLRQEFNDKKPPVHISFSLTKFDSRKKKLPKTGATVRQHRFVIPINVKVNEKKELVFENMEIKTQINDPRTEDVEELSPYIHLPTVGLNTNEVAFVDVIKAALASSAFPVAFSPIRLYYSFSNSNSPDGGRCHRIFEPNVGYSEECNSSYFSDGGLFDNSPVGVAVDFIKGDQSHYDGGSNISDSVGVPSIVFITPEPIRSETCLEEDRVRNPSVHDLIDYGDYLLNAFDVGNMRFYYRAMRELEVGDFNYYTSTRRFPLAGNFHYHFSAFYSKDFRFHDYLVGVYDGIMFHCNSLEEDVARKSCMQHSFEDWFNDQMGLSGGHPCDESGAKDRDVAYEFLRYLYNMEFSSGDNKELKDVSRVLNVDHNQNTLIAISEALQQCEVAHFDVARREKKSEFECFISKLAKNSRGKAISGRFSNDTIELLDRYSDWKSNRFHVLYDRILKIQKRRLNELQVEQVGGLDTLYCGKSVENDQKELREVIKGGLAAARPVFDSSLEHADSGIWPLSKMWGFPLSLYYGFDVRESAQLVSLKPIRKKLTSRLSLDVAANYHHLSRDRAGDHYFSMSAGLTYHLEQFIFPTIEVGYERSFAGEKYDRSLSSLYIYTGILNELMRIGMGYRLDDVHDLRIDENPRAQFQLMLQVNVTQLGSIIWGLF